MNTMTAEEIQLNSKNKPDMKSTGYRVIQVILVSSNGSRVKITLDDAGNFVIEELTEKEN